MLHDLQKESLLLTSVSGRTPGSVLNLTEWETLGEMKPHPIANSARKAHCSVAHKFISGTLSNKKLGAKDAIKLSSKPHHLSAV